MSNLPSSPGSLDPLELVIIGDSGQFSPTSDMIIFHWSTQIVVQKDMSKYIR